MGVGIVLQNGGHDLRDGTAHDHHVISLVAEVAGVDFVVIELVDLHTGDRNSSILGEGLRRLLQRIIQSVVTKSTGGN